MIGSYGNVIASRKEGIEKKRAYLVGGGIASLAAAAYLLRDGHMAGEKITILEQLDVNGGSLDGSGNAIDGYIMRGGREMEAHYECTWDLFSFIPDLMRKDPDELFSSQEPALVSNPNQSVLKTIRDINQWDPNASKCRLMSNCGKPDRDPSLGLSLKHVVELTKLTLKTEEELGATTVEEFFSDSYFKTNMWYFWTSMFAMETWHSVVEMRRYMLRFMHLMPTMSKLEDILFTTYNQYESMVLPLQTWLKNNGVNFDLKTQVTDLDIEIVNGEKIVTAIHLLRGASGNRETITTTVDDLIFVTNGSMTENSTTGNNDEPAILNSEVGACWNLWNKIAAKDAAFGKPEVFCSHIDKSKFVSFTITATDSPIADLLKEFTGVDPYSHRAVTGGIMTIKDSSWLMSVTCNRQPQYRSQPVGDYQPKQFKEQPDKNVLAIWAYGLFPDNIGDFVKKRMGDCTGEELLTELLCHWGAKEQIPAIMKTVKVIPCMMPYITSQFLPRVKGDRPEVVPEGSRNLAFLGQFTEIPDDCVFTVEYSVRSAIMAVYKLLGITDKTPPEIYPSKDDVHVVIKASETMYGGNIPGEHLLTHLLQGTSLQGLLK
ncbi:MAG: oleate hydratase [Gammaproteobacteria bacterium]|nr:oleate hydratase [Gammaproteobacteria bacterium]MCP5417542.1 oleate hydratase [Chromatiaceae bacterium]